jgi:outer membrane protein TolC
LSRHFFCFVSLFAFAAAAAETPSPVERLDFDAAVAEALSRNPTVAVAMADVRRAEAIVIETRAASLPSLVGNAGYIRLDGDRLSGGVVILPQSQLQASLAVTVPLLSTKNWADWAHARDAAEVARLSVAEVRRQLAISVARVFLALIAQHRAVEVNDRARVAARSHLDYAHARFAGGYGNRLDEVRAGEELATDEAQLETALAQLARLQEALGVLLGTDHPCDAADDLRLPSIPSKEEAVASAPDLRSDVKLFQLRRSAAHHLVRDSWTDLVPSLVGSFVPFLQDPPTPTLPSSGWQAQLALSVPIFDGGWRYGLFRERRAIELSSLANLEATLRQAAADVRASYAEIDHARASAAAARNAAKLAEEALALTNLAYRAGATTNIEVIDAERRSRDAATTAVIAEDAERQAVIDVLVASGRFPPAR